MERKKRLGFSKCSMVSKPITRSKFSLGNVAFNASFEVSNNVGRIVNLAYPARLSHNSDSISKFILREFWR